MEPVCSLLRYSILFPFDDSNAETSRDTSGREAGAISQSCHSVRPAPFSLSLRAEHKTRDNKMLSEFPHTLLFKRVRAKATLSK